MLLGSSEVGDTPLAGLPLSKGSISVGLHPGPGRAEQAVAELLAQAVAADASGFDGVTLSEHHGGHPGYLPVPLLMAGRLMAALPRAWVAPCPTILPLWDFPNLVEQVAWLAACWPRRLGVGVVPGYQERDFAIAGRSFGGRVKHFAGELPRVAAALSGSDAGDLNADPAVKALSSHPVPVVAGVGGPKGVSAAARARVGLLVTSLTTPARAKMLTDRYREEGGSGPVVLIRRVWIGALPAGVKDQIERYRAAGLPGAPAADAALGEIACGEPAAVIAKLTDDIVASGSDALNLRLTSDVPSREVEEQLRVVGREVLSEVRTFLAQAPAMRHAPKDADSHLSSTIIAMGEPLGKACSETTPGFTVSSVGQAAIVARGESMSDG
jgi:alkanesulfonate monooxygenase SsuD/methylene tetrahydromethanopterin reductase-like flavin-dependent oxidoreductase (luciferase family)